MTQARPSRSILVLFGLLGGAAVGVTALTALRPEWLRAGPCCPGSGPEAQAGTPAVEDEDSSRVAFI